MPRPLVESARNTKRTLILCIMLGASAAAHRWIVGMSTVSAADLRQMAASFGRTAKDVMHPPSLKGPLPSLAPREEGDDEDAPEGGPDPSADRAGPYAKRLWTVDPFRSPNRLRLADAQHVTAGTPSSGRKPSMQISAPRAPAPQAKSPPKPR